MTAVIKLPLNKGHEVFVRFHYFDIGLQEEHSHGYALRIDQDQFLPVPIVAPDKYTLST